MKKPAQISLALVLSLALSACGGGGLTSTTPPPVPTLTTLTLSASSLTVVVGATATLQVAGKDQFGKPISTTVTFASDNPAADVDDGGTVTGVAVGNANISAKAPNGVSSSVFMTIAPDPPVLTSITLTPGNAQIQVGDTQQYAATGYDQYLNAMPGLTFTFSSGNINFVSIDSNGLAIGVAPGMTGITASANGMSKTQTVTVVPPPPPPPPPSVLTTITLSPSIPTTLAIGHTETFTASAFDQYSKPMVVAFTWASDNASVNVDTGGTVTGVSAGGANVTATSGSVSSLPAQVTVEPKPTITRLSPPIALVGSTYSVPLTITGTNFEADSIVNGFSAPLTPTSVTPSKLVVMVPQSEFASAATVQVTVSTNEGGASTALPFYVTAQGFVSINFDDGYQSTYDHGLPIFDKAGMSYTWYIITHKPLPAPSYFANWMEIVNQAGKPNVEIGNHTQTHAGVQVGGTGPIRFLTLLNSTTDTTLNSPDYGSPVTTNLTDETQGAQTDLLGMGIIPTTFAYPYGDYDDSPDPGNDPNSLPLAQQPVELAVQAAGMKGARTTNFCQDQTPPVLPGCGYVGGNTQDKLPYALFAFEVNQNGNVTTLDTIKYWTSPALPSNVGVYPTKTWTIITFHQVDEDRTVEVDSVDHTLLQGMVDYFIAQNIYVVTSDEGMTIMGLNGLN